MQDKWVNNDGFDLSVFTPTKWISYVFTAGLLVVTLVYLALYILNGMTGLVACSFVCIGALAVSFYLIAKGPDMRYIFVNYADIIFFMIANVGFLGTGCGFQLYCFGFVTSAMFMSLTAGSGGKVLWQSWLIIGLSAAYFFAVTLWFNFHEPLYSLNNPLLVTVIYILNAAATMACLVLFTATYMATAANLGQRLMAVSKHDELTRLLNRRGFYPIIEEAFEKNAGRAGFCYFAMADIDHFKVINDRYGHKSGDVVLQRVSEVFTDYSRRWPELQASRWGGEEFLFMYAPPQNDTAEAVQAEFEAPGIGLGGIRELLERLRQEIADLSITVDGNVLHCTITVGIADFAEGATTSETINLADKRLYAGKQAGRNRVVVATDTEAEA